MQFITKFIKLRSLDTLKNTDLVKEVLILKWTELSIFKFKLSFPLETKCLSREKRVFQGLKYVCFEYALMAVQKFCDYLKEKNGMTLQSTVK